MSASPTPYHNIEARVLDVLSAIGRPVLRSELEYWTGRDLTVTLERLIKVEAIEPVFPEAVEGDSGRQFWMLRRAAA